MEINVTKLNRELINANIPFHSVTDTGEIDYKDEATEEQKELAKKIVANHNSYDYAEERRKFYPSIGNQLDYLFWSLKQLKESEMKDWNGIDEWFKKIQEVKDKFPKQ